MRNRRLTSAKIGAVAILAFARPALAGPLFIR